MSFKPDKDQNVYWKVERQVDVAGRRDMEKALEESEQRYRKLVENASEAIVVARGDRLVYVNPAGVALMGYTEEEIYKRSFWEFIHPDDLSNAVDNYQIFFGQESAQNRFPLRAITKDGSVRWIELSGTLINWENEKALLGFISDITEQKMAIEALEESEKKYREILSTIEEGYYEVDLAGNFCFFNDSFSGLMGYSHDELFSVSYKNIYVNPKEIFQIFNRVYRTGVPEKAADLLIKTGDGQKRYIEISVSLRRDEQGQPIGFQGVTRDITGRKEKERQIKEKNAILAQLNNIALEQAGMRSYENLVDLLLQQLQENTGAVVAVFNEYDPENRVLVTRKVKTEEKIINTAVSLGGKKILNTETPVDDATHYRIISNVINYHSTLTQASEGAIPAGVSLAIQKMLGIERFVTLSHVAEGKIYGTSMIGLNEGQVLSSLEFLESFAHVSAISLRRLQAEQKVASYTRELEQLNRQLDREMEKAREVHERTLPISLPEVEGISFAAHYQPAQKIGGDFYDLIRTGDRLIFYFSDVMGHGVDGAILSMFVKEAIDSYVSLRPEELEPEKILRHLNEQYRRQNFPEEYLICIFLAVLDLETMELRCCGAGFQTLPLVRQADGDVFPLTNKGLPVSSVIPAELLDFKTEHLALTPGTTIFISTDGLTEQAAGEELYNNRLKKVFAAYSHLSPDCIAQVVKEDFRAFNQGVLQGRDDITFCVLQVEPEQEKTLKLELDSRLEELGGLQDKVAAFIPGDEGAPCLLNGLHELAANAMEHGNKLDPEKKVFVQVTAAEGYYFAIVEDQGEGFDWETKMKGTLNLQGPEERGRGIVMTGLLCDRLFYNETGNRAFLYVNNR